jgi:hypothetical protein
VICLMIIAIQLARALELQSHTVIGILLIVAGTLMALRWATTPPEEGH